MLSPTLSDGRGEFSAIPRPLAAAGMQQIGAGPIEYLDEDHRGLALWDSVSSQGQDMGQQTLALGPGLRQLYGDRPSSLESSQRTQHR